MSTRHRRRRRWSGPRPRDPKGSAAFEVATDDAAATFECSLDGAPFAPCDAAVASAGLADGLHTFEARATDTAGNTDASPACLAGRST